MKPSKLLLFVLCARLAFGALSTTVVWEVRPTNGLDTNGGGFDPGVASPGTDFSQQNSTQVSYTDLVVGATTTQVTSAAHAFGSTYPGNLIHIASGTGCTTGWFEVVSVTTITATLDRSAGTAASVCTGSLGGALKTLAQLNTNMSLDQQGWAKAESTLVMGRINWNFASTGYAAVTGYTATRGDNGMFTVQMNAADFFWVMTTNSQNTVFKNFIIDCNGTCNGDAFYFQGCCMTGYNIQVKNVGAHIGVNFTASRNVCAFCYVTGVSGGGIPIAINDGLCYYCVAYGNTSTGVAVSMGSGGGGAGGPACWYCIAANNTSTTAAFSIAQNQGPSTLVGSVAVNNGGDGLKLSSSTNQFPIFVVNNIFYGNSGYGIDYSASTLTPGGNVFNFNAFGANTSGARHQISAGANDVTLSGNPFTNSAGNDFSLNAGAGAALYGVGLPGALTVGGTGFLDIGALQHQAVAGGGISGSPIQ